MRIEAGYGKTRTRDAKMGFEARHHDARRRDDQFGRELRQRLAQGDMNGHRHDRERGRPQQHDRLGRGAVRCGELGKIFGMAGVTKSGAVEHVLRNRVGDDRSRAAGHHVTDRLADRSHGSFGTAAIGMARAGGCNLADGNDRQSLRERGARIFRANLGKPDVQAKRLDPAPKRGGIADPIEGRQFEFVAAKPRLKRNVGSDACGFARCQREGLCHALTILDRHCFVYSIIAAARTSRKYDFDFASYFSLYILSRISRFLGVSTLVGSFAHSTTISIPCRVTSGGVRWPIAVLSRISRSAGGISAEVLVTLSRIAAFCMVLKNWFASTQVWMRARRASASFLRASIAS